MISEISLRASESRFRAMIEKSADGIVLLDDQGNITYSSPAIERIFGYQPKELFGMPEELFGIMDESCVQSGDRPELRRRLNDLVHHSGSSEGFECRLLHKYGHWVWLDVTVTNLLLDPDVRAIVVNFRDVTARKQAEATLHASEEHYRLLFERNLSGFYRASIDGVLLEGNQSFARILGFDSFDQLRGKALWPFCANPGEPTKMLEILHRSGRLNNYELELKRSDETCIWTLSNITVLPAENDEAEILEGVLLDITDRKKSEDEIKNHREQLRALSAKIESVREEERKSIAREIHDQLGQLMTGLKLEIAWVEKQITQTEDQILRQKLIPKMNEIGDLLETTIQTVRDIASKLRPGHLDDLGLIAAIQWEAQNICKRLGVKPEFNLCREPANLPSDCAIGLFRIFQEIMTNVARHAQATKVQINLADSNDEILFVVKDDGLGITSEKLNDPKSLGLIGMKERALLLNGEVIIEPLDRAGTQVTVRIPRS